MLRFPRPHSISVWTRLVALLLGGVLLFQAAPVQPVLQLVQHVECPCDHEGICPRNPNGPCTCDHSSSSSDAGMAVADGPVFQDCDGASQNAVNTVSTIKALFGPTPEAPDPSLRFNEPSFSSDALSPQRMGDDIFRPPRVDALPRRV